MSLESDIFDSLKGLVSNRVYPDAFPQNTTWPTIRYVFVDAVPGLTICGSGDDAESDIRIQLDGVAPTGEARDALRLAIVSAMRLHPIETTLDSWSKSYDPETKAYRIQMDYFLQPSST